MTKKRPIAGVSLRYRSESYGAPTRLLIATERNPEMTRARISAVTMAATVVQALLLMAGAVDADS
jgi:hypothetical protein